MHYNYTITFALTILGEVVWREGDIENESEDQSDDQPDNEPDDEDLKGEKLVSYLKTRYIRGSISDITENPDSHMGSRRISTISEN